MLVPVETLHLALANQPESTATQKMEPANVPLNQTHASILRYAIMYTPLTNLYAFVVSLNHVLENWLEATAIQLRVNASVPRMWMLALTGKFV